MKLQNLSHLRINVLFVNFVNTYEQCQQDKIYVLEGVINEFCGFEATLIVIIEVKKRTRKYIYLSKIDFLGSMIINKIDSTL